MIRLEEKSIKYLMDQPETGMGYQCVSVKFADGTDKEALVFNCEELQLDTNKTIVSMKVLKVTPR